MRIHICLFDEDCKKYGAPRRIYLNGSKWQFTIGQRCQRWSRKLGYTDKWRFITYSPTSDRLCYKVTGAECGRLAGHSGLHCLYDWTRRVYVQSD